MAEGKFVLVRITLAYDDQGRTVAFTRHGDGVLCTRVYRPGEASVARLVRAVDALDSPWGYGLAPRVDGWTLTLAGGEA